MDPGFLSRFVGVRRFFDGETKLISPSFSRSTTRCKEKIILNIVYKKSVKISQLIEHFRTF